MKSINLFVVALGLFSLAGVASGQGTFLLVPDSGRDQIDLFDATTGELVQEGWVTYAAAGITGFSTPRAAIQVGKEIWVSDQVQDKIYRWQARRTSPAYLGEISGGLDNIKGMRQVGLSVLVTNGGTDNGAPGEALVRISPTGVILGSFLVQDPFDVLPYQGGLLTIQNTLDNIDRYSLAGTFLSVFHDSDGVSGIDLGQQMNTDAAGNVIVSSFSAPVGIYRYNSSGAQINYWPVGNGNRGIYELPGGLILYTHSTDVSVLNPADGSTVTLYTGFNASMQFIHVVTFICPADFDADGFVTGDDFDAYVLVFELGFPAADFDGDGFVTGDDFDAFVLAFEAGC